MVMVLSFDVARECCAMMVPPLEGGLEILTDEMVVGIASTQDSQHTQRELKRNSDRKGRRHFDFLGIHMQVCVDVSR